MYFLHEEDYGWALQVDMKDPSAIGTTGAVSILWSWGSVRSSHEQTAAFVFNPSVAMKGSMLTTEERRPRHFFAPVIIFSFIPTGLEER